MTWLSRRNVSTSLYALYDAPGYYLFRLDLPNDYVRLWRDWAAEYGVSREWMDEKARSYQYTRACESAGGEFITELPIGREQWTHIWDMGTGKPIPTDARALCSGLA